MRDNIKEWLSYHFILRPALLYQFGYRLFHQTLQSLAGVVAALVKLEGKKKQQQQINEKANKHSFLKKTFIRVPTFFPVSLKAPE